MNRLTGAGGVALVAALILVMAGCAPVGRGVGSQEPTVVLTLANASDGHEALQPFADAVAKATNGTLSIEFKDGQHAGDPSFETKVIDDVYKGVSDLGWTAPRPWHDRGVTSFDALMAPFLIDSYPLEGEVLGSDLEPQMLAGLEGTGLVGLGILPGPMRHVATADGTFGDPDSLRGDVVAIGQSFIAAQTFRALGATTVDLAGGGELGTATATEAQLAAIIGNRYDHDLTHITVDAPLWPRPVILFANKVRFESLSEAQRTALRTAAKGLLPSTLDALAREDAGAITELCADGADLEVVGSDRMPALRAAVQPVLGELAKDAGTAAAIKRITEMKAGVGATAAAPTCPAGGPSLAPESAGGFPDGTYEDRVTCEEFQAFWESHDIPLDSRGPCASGDVAVGGFTKKDGVLVEDYGAKWSYSFFGDHVRLSDYGSQGPGFILRWTYDGKQVTFSEIQGGMPDDEVAWTIKPFMRIDDPEPSPGAGIPDGRYAIDVSAEEMQAAWSRFEVPVDKRELCPCHFEFALKDGAVTETDNGHEFKASVAGDHLTISDDDMEMTVRWAYDPGTRELTLTEPNGGHPGDRAVWCTKPYVKLD